MMKAVCDGCGKETTAIFNGSHWIRPTGWYQRDVSASRTRYVSDEDGKSWATPTVILICSLPFASLVVDKFKEIIKI